jgi:glycosyltransferase involved in cell wall biosynthesis
MTPEISFVIPTYNAGFHLNSCLSSIRDQDYPQELVEILVADGGSSDNTLEIARSYNCQVLDNPKRLAEYGVQLGVQKTSGDFIVVFAADNELIGTDWIHKVIGVFNSDTDVSSVWGRLASEKNDPALNKYFELIQSDPLNWFLNNNLMRYKAKSQFYAEDCFKFEVDPRRPLVWGANGLVYRASRIKAIWAQEGYLGDNDAFQRMIEEGNNKVVYFDCPFVYHHHVVRITDWVKKWRRNFIQHLADQRQTRNMNWVFTDDFKIKLFFWIIYSLIPIFSLLHSIYLSFRDKNIYWFYHPFISFIQTATYSTLILFNHKGRNLIKNIIFAK